MKRPVQSRLPPFRIDAESRTPLTQQICGFLRSAIQDGIAPPGSYLPSSRALAASLRVSRNTVVQAYETLWTEGFLTAKSGSGTRVKPGLRLAPRGASLQEILRESKYPFRARHLEDPDGNALSLQYSKPDVIRLA